MALLKVVDSWKMAIDKGVKSVSVFLDLRKAFDVIRHDLLLTKLQSHGVKESELRWFNSYQSLRDHSVSSSRTLFRLRCVSLLVSLRGRF